MDLTIERVGDLILLEADDGETDVTIPMDLQVASRLASALSIAVSGKGGNQLNLLDVPGGIDR